MPSNLKIEESSDEPTPTERGGEIEGLDGSKTTGEGAELVIEEADAQSKLPVVRGGSIKKIKRPRRKDKRWWDDDRNNPLHVRQWVYDSIVGAAAAVLLLSFLVIVIASALYGKLDFKSFMGEIGPFLGGLGIGYGATRGGKGRKTQDDDEPREGDAGNDSS